MKKYRLIGLTGTTGAGKSTVSEIFRDRGFCVIDADLLAREIMTDEVVLGNIAGAFGADVVSGGKLNRSLLAEKAFAYPKNTALLNRLTHPYITELLLKRLSELVAAGEDRIVLDAPQLFESRLNLICDVVVAVVADRKERERRIISRDNIEERKAEQRMSAQLSDIFFKANSDYVIENNSSREELADAVNIFIDEAL